MDRQNLRPRRGIPILPRKITSWCSPRNLTQVLLKADARRLGMASALTATAAFTGFLVLVMLCFALAYGLITAGVWDWAAAGN